MEKEKKLRLGKTTIQDFNTVLEKGEQEALKGGTADGPLGTTQVPIFCKP